MNLRKEEGMFPVSPKHPINPTKLFKESIELRDY